MPRTGECLGNGVKPSKRSPDQGSVPVLLTTRGRQVYISVTTAVKAILPSLSPHHPMTFSERACSSGLGVTIGDWFDLISPLDRGS